MDNGIKKGNPAVEKAELIAKKNAVEREIKTEIEQVDGVKIQNTTEIVTDKQKVNDLKRQKRAAIRKESASRKKSERQAMLELKAQKHAERVKLKRAKAEHKAELKKAKAEERAYLKRVKAEQRHEHRQQEAERSERRRDNKRKRGVGGWIAAVVSLGCATLILGSLLTLSMFTDYMEMGKVNTNSATTQRSFYDFVGYVDNIETNMAKMFVSSDSEGQQKILGEIVVQSNLADVALSELPVMDESKYKTSKYINQLGDYAKYLNNQLIDGRSLTNEEISTLKELYRVNGELKKILSELSENLGENYDFSQLSNNDNADKIITSLNDIENNTMQYPEMVYDGPFSDGLTGKTPKGISGEEINELRAVEIFEDVFSRYGLGNIEVLGLLNNGEIECYNVKSETEQNGEVYAQISKIGGKLVMFNAYRDCTGEDVSEAEGVQIAEQFLDSLGLTQMNCVWSYVSGSTQYLNFAFDDGIIAYPDLIKVKVCRERGIVSGIDADGYYMNHTKRSFEEPKYTVEEAREKVSKDLEIRSSALSVIPTGGGNERLAYEFIGDANGETYYVYLDANTLKQADIFKVVNTKQGRLLI